MHDIFHFFSMAFAVVIIGLAAVVTVKLLDGTIRTNGLLQTAPGARGTPNPERLLALGGTLAAGVGYFIYALRAEIHDNTMPDFPEYLLPLIGGTNIAYLGGKFLRGQGIIS